MTIEFDKAFHALTGYTPLRWQGRLFMKMSDGRVPKICDLPTGLGKTSVIPVWLIALAAQAQRKELTLPRRLAYIVNRRTVVDQATDLVIGIRDRLLAPKAEHQAVLEAMRHALLSMTASENGPLAVSTLRGGLADNEEWKEDPTRPAIIIGTIDMIGSKLLFSGYGDGRYKRAHHAGLIGQDTLIVHDEAHLTPAFSELLSGIKEYQAKEALPNKVLELSATARDASEAFSLTTEDEADTIVNQRLSASKELRFQEVEEKDAMLSAIAEQSFAHEGKVKKVVVFITSPEDAQKVLKNLEGKLKKEKDRVALLTGTLRGFERDELVSNNKVFRAMLGRDEPEGTVYLVSTSAGEVGIDIDPDALTSDLTTLDAFIQRLGRVNRKGGEGRKATVDVVALKPKEKKAKKKAGSEEESADEPADARTTALLITKEVLQKWATSMEDLCPRNLKMLMGQLDPEVKANAFSPKGAIKPLTDILLDAWALTSISGELPGRSEVAAYLHGVEPSLPETLLVWRSEVEELDKAGLNDEELREWFSTCPVLVREQCKNPSYRVKKTLGDLLKKQQDKAATKAVVLDERGQAKWITLGDIAKAKDDSALRYKTLVLPTALGGLNQHGLLDHTSQGAVKDVGDQDAATDGATRQRWILREDEDGATWTRLTTNEEAEEAPHGMTEKLRIPLAQAAEGTEEGANSWLVLLEDPNAASLGDPERANAEQSLAGHLSAIERYAEKLAEKFGLQDPIKQALILAARWHDLGKARAVWQRYARNSNMTHPLAKARRYCHPRELNGYRHEFGSLVDAQQNEDFKKLDEDTRELVLHLIAAHHGWARPHFERRAWDPQAGLKANERLATEVMQRYGRLQLKYGRWGLAWLESLLRCADIRASQEAVSQPVTEKATA